MMVLVTMLCGRIDEGVRTPWVVNGSSRSILAWNSPLPPPGCWLETASVLRVVDILMLLV